ncbi:protocatechuate 3,4-dioxygenase subunit alpha [Mycetocola zhadangensis]|uniref:Protocatechuate 3,4-dioxygenase subunit alpha n=1 Tax=Mycetocola zhadangensis TaxID=1164595 RepID=A0A3L7ISJ6_9MICO|nr:protocatechuate 3,4-dioxygenase subunit alpha [Mycetocola zhadangensis]RLQ81153.1 protocatechuate 3,4-dioxygenase subunit alpha [Mycetocola zhadangensis]GGF05217.1 protocatechuate 3,4-dioxygenase subunit alpha [Mycetocola zhadangensis]
MPDAPLGQTPSQTVGPFFGYALPFPGGPQVAAPWHPESIRLHGTVYDGAGDAIPDAIIEIWHADSAGRVIAERGSLDRNGHTVTGFGRSAVNRAGEFEFSTIKPGSTRADAAPYILVTVFARGLTHHLFTRAYFGDEVERNEGDPFLATVDPLRRPTLIAAPDAQNSYRFDIRLQGEGETVFLDFDAEIYG